MNSARNLTFVGPPDWPEMHLTLSVLGFRDGKEWRVIALDMDLEAFGSSFEEACNALAEMIVAQVTFAMQKRQPQLVLRPAEPVYWQIYERERAVALRNFITQSEVNDQVRIGSLPVPQELVAQYQHRKPFRRQHAA